MTETTLPTEWDGVAKTLHWSVAALVFTQIVLGWLAVHWPLTPTKIDLFVWHKSLGMLILLLVLLRLAWRVTHHRPPYPQGMKNWEKRLAGSVHGLFYALLIAMPISGWLLNSAAHVPVRLFWAVPLPALMGPDRHLVPFFAVVHVVMGWTLAILIVLHVFAALLHHFWKRDRLLLRMFPRLSTKAESS